MIFEKNENHVIEHKKYILLHWSSRLVIRVYWIFTEILKFPES